MSDADDFIDYDPDAYGSDGDTKKDDKKKDKGGDKLKKSADDLGSDGDYGYLDDGDDGGALGKNSRFLGLCPASAR